MTLGSTECHEWLRHLELVPHGSEPGRRVDRPIYPRGQTVGTIIVGVSVALQSQPQMRSRREAVGPSVRRTQVPHHQPCPAMTRPAWRRITSSKASAVVPTKSEQPCPVVDQRSSVPIVCPQPVGPLQLALGLTVRWRDGRTLVALDDATISPRDAADALRHTADLLDKVAIAHRDAELIAEVGTILECPPPLRDWPYTDTRRHIGYNLGQLRLLAKSLPPEHPAIDELTAAGDRIEQWLTALPTSAAQPDYRDREWDGEIVPYLVGTWHRVERHFYSPRGTAIPTPLSLT
jgi:hypothetical protein